MNERKYQQEIKKLQKTNNNMIEEKFYEQSLENMEKYDAKEKAKLDVLNKKKNEQVKMIKDQMEETKIKKLKEFQEKEIEGFMARQDYLDGVKDDEYKAEQEKIRKNKLKEEFIKGNEDDKISKKNRIIKEIKEVNNIPNIIQVVRNEIDPGKNYKVENNKLKVGEIKNNNEATKIEGNVRSKYKNMKKNF